jgi:hypothetical protein
MGRKKDRCKKTEVQRQTGMIPVRNSITLTVSVKQPGQGTNIIPGVCMYFRLFNDDVSTAVII